MHMVLVVAFRRSRFSCFCPELKKCCHGDRSHASSVPVTHQRLVVVSTIEVSGASDAPQGAASVEVVDAGRQLGDSAGSLL
jgi:hypothetical protein